MTDENNTPHFNGDADDIVKLSGFTRQSDAIQTYDEHNYDVYESSHAQL
ncbi:MAG: hypothetical protein V6Z86_00835 [Hyphomicrobiales bacterium]